MVVFAGVDQVAHLGDALVLFGRLHHGPAFLDAVRQRLLAVDVLAGLAGQDGRNPVPVVGRGDHDRVDVFAVEHPAKIAVGLRRSARRRLGPVEVGLVDVADRRDLDLRKLLECIDQAGPHAADADEAQHDLLAGRDGRPARFSSAPGRLPGRFAHGRPAFLGASACATARAPAARNSRRVQSFMMSPGGSDRGRLKDQDAVLDKHDVTST